MATAYRTDYSKARVSAGIWQEAICIVQVQNNTCLLLNHGRRDEDNYRCGIKFGGKTNNTGEMKYEQEEIRNSLFSQKLGIGSSEINYSTWVCVILWCEMGKAMLGISSTCWMHTHTHTHIIVLLNINSIPSLTLSLRWWVHIPLVRRCRKVLPFLSRWHRIQWSRWSLWGSQRWTVMEKEIISSKPN